MKAQQPVGSRPDPAHAVAVSPRTPTGRCRQPGDIAGPVLFRAPQPVGVMTGTCLAIDGEYSIA